MTPRAHPSLNPISAVGGFLGNILGGAGEVVTGTTGIFSGVGSDIIKLATGQPKDLFTPAFLANLGPGLASDYSRRYGSLGGLAHGLYNDPLAYAFDILGAGALAGKGAEIASAAGRTSPVIDALLPKSRNILAHPEAQEFPSQGPRIYEVRDHRNPVTRFLVENTFNRRRFVPVQNLQQQVEAWKAFEGPLTSADKSLIPRYEAAIKKAQDAGVSLMESPNYAQHRVAKLALKLRSQFMATFAMDRQEITRHLDRVLEPLKNYSAEEIGRFDRATMMVEDLGMHHYSPEELIPQLQKKGFTSVEDAADAVYRGDPRVAALHPDEQAALRRTMPSPLAGTAVADASGEPLRVFHGTGNEFAGFDLGRAESGGLFGPGIYTTDNPRVASGYAMGPAPSNIVDYGAVGPTEAQAGANVRPLYLDIKNPFIADRPLTQEAADVLAQTAERAGKRGLPDFRTRVEEDATITYNHIADAFAERTGLGGGMRPSKVAANQFLQDAGFDGITYQGGTQLGGEEHRVFVAFDEKQVWPFKPNPNPGYNRATREVAVPSLATPPIAQAPFPDEPSLIAAATKEHGVFQDALRKLFGQNVRVSVKSLDRTLEKAATDQALPTDVLRARVMVADHKDAPGIVQDLQRAYPEHAIEDTRGGGTTWGQRRLAVTVRTPSGLVAEVEITTPRVAEIRDANATTEHFLERTQNEAVRIERELANPDLSPENATKLMKRGAVLHKSIDATRKQLQANWEQVADELDSQVNGKALPGGGKREAFNLLRTFVWKWETAPLIDQGVFDPARTFESAYAPLRVESGAEWDVEAQDLVGGKTADELHAELQAQDLPMPIYYPQISVDVRGPSGLLSGRNLKPGVMKRLSTPSYLKARTGKLYMDDTYIRDVKDAHMRRAIAMLQNRDTLDFIRNVINQFGRPIEDAAEVSTGADAAEALIAPMGFLNFFNARLGLTDKMLKALAESLHGEISTDELQAIMEDIMPKVQRQIIGVTKRGVQLYAVPRVVRDMIEGGGGFKDARVEKAARIFWDTPNKVWRSLVLTGRPAWLTNNTLGSALFLGMQPGAKILTAFRQLDEPFAHALGARLGNERLAKYTGFRTAAREVIPEEIRPQVTTGLFMTENPGAMNNLGFATPKEGTFLDTVSRTWHSNRVIKRLHSFGQRMQKINSEIEDINRTASFVGEAELQAIKANVLKGSRRFWSSKEDLKLLARRGMTPENAARALDKVNYFHHDYNALTPFERNEVRRFAVPFYNFYKHVVQLALHYPFDYGNRMAVAAGFARFDKEMQNDKLGALPSYLQGAWPLGPVGPDGVAFFSGANANPFQAVIPTTTFSFLNLAYPQWKVTAEQTFGRSALTGRAFTDANVIVPFGTEIGYRIDDQGRFQGVETDTKPGILEHLLQQVPEYTLAKDIAAGGRSPDTMTLPSIIGQRIMGHDPRSKGYSGTPLPISAAQMIGRFMGVPTYTFDPQGYQAGLQKGTQDALALWSKLRAMGEAGPAPGPVVTPTASSGMGNLFG